MKKRMYLFGDVNTRGEADISTETSIKRILAEHAGGMSGSKKVKLVQIGGPLGVCIRGKDLHNPLSDYVDGMDAATILFLNDIMCPVDFLRFCTRFVIRELGIKNEHTVRLNTLIEGISKGDALEADFDALRKEAQSEAATYAENALHALILSITTEFQSECMRHLIEKRCDTGICRRLADAQCLAACPAEVHVPGYVALMAEDRIAEAYGLMRQKNPLSFVCGKVCARPCEVRCRRGEIEHTVGVRALKRYAADMALQADGYTEDKLEDNGKTVGIIGGGPAGLTAAYYLARSGYGVTVYERHKVIGGMLAVGIPEYRLPQETIDKEVKLIEKLGVQFQLNISVGQDVSFQDIRTKHDAMLLATGCHIGMKVGPESDGVETALDFLREVRIEGRKTVGDHVLVIGGGDVAMDAARTAVRLGAKSVKAASLESYDIMPAGADEKIEAQEEGVELIDGYGIKEIHAEDGRVTGITLQRCVTVFDDDYRFSPQYDGSETKQVETDHIILAIGQKADVSYLDKDVQVSERGWIQVDPLTFATSAKGVYAAGDMYKPGIAIKAIAEAQKAAESIDRHLGGSGLYVGKPVDIPSPQLSFAIWDTAKTEEQILPLEQRRNSFTEIGCTFTAADAQNEARRCMRCDRNSKQ